MDGIIENLVIESFKFGLPLYVDLKKVCQTHLIFFPEAFLIALKVFQQRHF